MSDLTVADAIRAEQIDEAGGREHRGQVRFAVHIRIHMRRRHITKNARSHTGNARQLRMVTPAGVDEDPAVPPGSRLVGVRAQRMIDLLATVVDVVQIDSVTMQQNRSSQRGRP
jgi:hypothetical protein